MAAGSTRGGEDNRRLTVEKSLDEKIGECAEEILLVAVELHGVVMVVHRKLR